MKNQQETTYDLNSEDGNKAFYDLGPKLLKRVKEKSLLVDCFKKGLPFLIRYGEYPIFVLGYASTKIKERGFVVLKGNEFYATSLQCLGSSIVLGIEEGETPSMLVVKSLKGSKWKNPVILNGDDEDMEGGEVCNLVWDMLSYKEEFPTISFACLSRLLDLGNEKDLCKIFSSGRLQILDYIPDSMRDLTEKEKKKVKDYKSKMPKRRGFTRIGGIDSGRWHRSSTVLIQDTKNKKTFLLGQDEGTYFGVELKGSPKTVKEAFEDLVPEEVKGKKGVLRQGEWFAIRVDKKEVPEKKDCVLLFQSGREDESPFLPIEDDEESNPHYIYSDDGRVSKKGELFVKGVTTLGHEEHSDLILVGGWWTFIKNTAVRSVSQEGVD